ncbi:MAG TPA: hypothetical protein VFC07_16170 [Verrucomicrobiae bacterium]|nr:hypothetical protein [Verrucomicrobiae bacterium]
MNGTNVTHETAHETWRGSLKSVATGGSVIEAIGGIAAVVLAIIGLAGGLRNDMAAIAVIVIGASLLFEGSALAASHRRLLSTLEGSSGNSAEFGEAMSVEFLAGFAGIVLGILALLGISTWTLIATAVIVFGSSFLLNSGAIMRLHSQSASALYTREQSREMAKETASAGAGGHMLIGLAAVVLGILALLNINPVVLSLVALLALGVSVLLSGSFFGTTKVMESRPA